MHRCACVGTTVGLRAVPQADSADSACSKQAFKLKGGPVEFWEAVQMGTSIGKILDWKEKRTDHVSCDNGFDGRLCSKNNVLVCLSCNGTLVERRGGRLLGRDPWIDFWWPGWKKMPFIGGSHWEALS
eukprot:1144631-Pelagomonas_calceolata.AAC.1